MVTMNASVNGAVNSRPLCERKIRGGQSLYSVVENVSHKPKKTRRAKPTTIGAITVTSVDDLYYARSVRVLTIETQVHTVVLMIPTSTRQTPGMTSVVPM